MLYLTICYKKKTVMIETELSSLALSRTQEFNFFFVIASVMMMVLMPIFAANLQFQN